MHPKVVYLLKCIGLQPNFGVRHSALDIRHSSLSNVDVDVEQGLSNFEGNSSPSSPEPRGDFDGEAILLSK